MPIVLFFAASFALLTTQIVHADIPEQVSDNHKQYYGQLLEEHCKPAVTDIENQSLDKVAAALTHAEKMDQTIDLEPGLLSQMQKLLPRYLECDANAQDPLEPIIDSFIAFLAVNRHLTQEERRAYVQFAMKLAELSKENEKLEVN
ncbi:hypothetical protein GCE9029_01169 [Grimontia celer]|uniref:Uncharacterized protein n=1 Tax=Grimontia celer TaxID=1796497 RepID=A0A128EY97_9GAMM|nr:hypothetical protein [Grimontia celer]CZF78966.1 hypothetical protein GCE9029_01169 [Grimontia celer]